MKPAFILIAMAIAPAGWHALQHMPVLTGIGITLFSALFIFTVMTARTTWKPSPILMEHIQNTAKLIAVIIIFAATAVVLVALADDGLTVMDVVRILINV